MSSVLELTKQRETDFLLHETLDPSLRLPFVECVLRVGFK